MHNVSDYERVFIGDRQISISHFYPIAGEEAAPTQFSFGYWTPDDFYHQGVVRWDRKTATFHMPDCQW